MDGCLDGCAGCFLWIAAFIFVVIVVYVLIGAFWIALIGGIIFFILWVIGRAITNLFTNDKRKKRR